MPVEINFPLNPEFQPMLQVGHCARLMRTGGEVNVEVIGIFPLGIHRHDFGTLSGNALDQRCTHIELAGGELAQYRYIPRGRFRVHLQSPSGVDIYTTNGSTKGNQTAGFFIDPVAEDPDELPAFRTAAWSLSEFFVYEDEGPRFDLYPLAPAAQIEAYVDFIGIGFALKPATRLPPTTLWVSGRPRGQELGT